MEMEIQVRLGDGDRGPLNSKEQGAGGGLQSAAWTPFGAGYANVHLLYTSKVDPALGTGDGLNSPLDLCPGLLLALVVCW